MQNSENDEELESPLTVTGVIHMNPRGFGFVEQELPALFPKDIFIPKPYTQGAVDGDTVEVMVVNEGAGEKGPEGRVLSIIKRGHTHLAGTVMTMPQRGDILAFAPLLGAEQKVAVDPGPYQIKTGDRVTLQVTQWGNRNSLTQAIVTRVIGHISDPSTDVPAAIEEYGIRYHFSQAVVDEAESYGNRVKAQEIAGREDLREEEIVTIDPTTAKDFDDAISLHKDSKGNFHLGVHIADVSHYVKRDSNLDKEARARCNSTYFPGICIPMLPHALSDNLCSLRPNVNRLTQSVMMIFNKAGDLINYRIVRSVIRSQKRFSYDEAKQVLDGKLESKHSPLLQRMVELCQLLKKKRYDRGCVEFALPEVVIELDEKGAPIKNRVIEYDITHQMIEEFMLKANEVVAKHITDSGRLLTYRVHESPEEESLRDFCVLANAFGFKLPDKPVNHDIQKLFETARETPYGYYLAVGFIRSMKLACYSSDNIGHYGLSLEHYCHFTSPIRRYADLIVHRLLFEKGESKEDLPQISRNCSEQERLSSKAEGRVLTLKKLRLLDRLKKEDPFQQCEAIVTRIKPFGFFFEVVGLMLEGFLHISELGNDYFVFNEKTLKLIGRHSGQSFSCGDRVKVMLTLVDLITGESKWCMVGAEKRERPKRNASGAARKPWTPKRKDTAKPKNKKNRKRKANRRGKGHGR